MQSDNYPTYLCYWGKTRKSDNDEGDAYHLLPYHCLDVAACGYELVINNRFHAAEILESLGFSRDEGAKWFAYFLSWHDIGKFARGFQQLWSHNNLALVPPVNGRNYAHRHDSLGYWIWKNHLCREWREGQANFLPDENIKKDWIPALDVWLKISCGHHGRPPEKASNSALAFTPDDFREVESWLLSLRQLFAVERFPSFFADKSWVVRLKQQSWLLAGLTVLADWLGSNTVHFPLVSQPMSLDIYWQRTKKQAEISISQLPATSLINPFHHHHQLFPFIQQLTPLQQRSVELNITSHGPQLIVMEDVTGAGKTEAALILAHRMMAQGKADGLYVGLPTMATANAMYQRLAAAYRQLFHSGSSPSLILAHGARQMSSLFNQSVWQQSDLNTQRHYAPDEVSGSAACDYWFADSRKKSLLAEVGVGTIDQLLMAIMPMNHQSLRILGLYNKILILDEIHAYDAYMVCLLERVLYFHAAQGGSAILLSATLPFSLRKKLLNAFNSGAGYLPITPHPQADYPWLSHLNSQQLDECHVATRNEVKRQVAVNWLTDEEEAIALIKKNVANGQCICWIRNTVDDAILAYQRVLQDINPNDALLFHSRFAFIDRMNIEQKVLTWFGKESGSSLRCGKVLIATQVIEQSLDIDLDLMISDLAPIDLLIQRAGRLQRHTRQLDGERKHILPDERPLPLLHILAPEWQPDAVKDWLGSTLKGTGFVYTDHACLWRTQSVLRDLGAICMPEQARMLIDGVYESLASVPEALQRVEDNVLGKVYGEQAAAKQILLVRDKGYDRNSSDLLWSKEIEISTRLSEDTIELYLALLDDDQILQPYADNVDFPWEQSRVQIRDSLWKKILTNVSYLQRDELERFRQQIHRPDAQVLLLNQDKTSDYYSQTWGLKYKS
ncbi:CRISPR-associated helicase Cas3' [Limnobaculum zhutongyuii]|uniref:CRISPR-associated helicase Cas3 n=1 Tax=Limnobaculum zhutongyuii TaxID=2498113 RepID=A0A411WKW4_9GAMM|nr:CRISPR-associated helicase Cas3' [Limnobaculum zhutongyuii]QBH96775.1 CRISPR-associated helicase Cas3' [Limnobaculum zhutongyuii]TQS90194.1 CRISPR-associated helicase Cas3' [Limnobaculum zhutongyuii]